MENARLVRWLKQVGDTVRVGEPVLELETEKSVVEIESAENGRLVEILLQVDGEAQVGDRVAWLENDAAEPATSQPVPSPASPPEAPAAPRAASQAPAAPEAAAASPTPQTAAATGPAGRANGRIRSSPVARRIASQHSVNLAQIAGTGPRGRIQLADVQRAIEARSSLASTATPPPIPAAPRTTASATPVGTFQPLSGMRRALARSM